MPLTNLAPAPTLTIDVPPNGERPTSSTPMLATGSGVSPMSMGSRRSVRAGLLSSIVNILNTILGAGMLAMPRGIASVGAILGAVCICAFGAASAFGLYLLTRCAKHTGRNSSFNSLSLLTYPKAAIFFDLAIGIKCFGVAVSYLVIIGDLMPQVMEEMFPALLGDHLLRQRRFWIAACMSVIVPTSFLRRLDSLKYTSVVALSAVVYVFILTIYFFFMPSVHPTLPEDQQPVLWHPSLLFFSRLSLFVFAFTCHQNIFSVYNELRRNTQARANTVIGSSIGISTLVYLVIGLLGYYMYGASANSNIFVDFPQWTVVTVGRIALTVLVVLSYALQCHPSRASLDKVLTIVQTNTSALWSSKSRGDYQQIDEEARQTSLPGAKDNVVLAEDSTATASTFAEESVAIDNGLPSMEALDRQLEKTMTQPPIPSTQIPTVRFVLLTMAILTSSFTIAMFVHDLGLVLGFVGATGSTTICYILPGLFYLKLHERDAWKENWTKVGALLMVIAGCLIMPVCLFFTVLDHANAPAGDGH